MGDQVSLEKRFKRFLILMGIIISMVTVIVIIDRLSDDALALLLGLVAGVVVMIPSVLLLGFLWRRQETRATEIQARPSVASAPPVVVVAPPMLPNYGIQRDALWNGTANAAWPMVQAERKFTIVGDES